MPRLSSGMNSPNLTARSGIAWTCSGWASVYSLAPSSRTWPKLSTPLQRRHQRVVILDGRLLACLNSDHDIFRRPCDFDRVGLSFVVAVRF
jgi:hypothetical protein